MTIPFRLLADDLTGALDSAAMLLPAAGTIQVRWQTVEAGAPGGVALSTESRDLSPAEAGRRVRQAAAVLFSDEALAFKKIDSLLRGPVGAEIAGSFEAGRFRNLVIAPAFPAQRRWTRGGVQFFADASGEIGRTPRAIAAMLAEEGLAACLVEPGASLQPGVSVCDAETDGDLRNIVEAGLRLPGRTLWCGTAGLASALAGPFGPPRPPIEPPAGGILGLVGTAHPVMRGQLDRLEQRAPAMLGRIRSVQPAALAEAADAANRRTAIGRSAVLAFDLPSTPDAPHLIEAALPVIAAALARPAALFVSGGETCRLLAEALACDRLDVEGIWRPGIAAARLAGGRLSGVPAFAKSGAFGDPDTILDLLSHQEQRP